MMLIEFLIAFVGLFGVGLGVAASLIPAELVKKRDEYERVTRIWVMISYELGVIVSYCYDGVKSTDDLLKAIQENPSIILTDSHVITPLHTAAWQIASSNGEFIVHASEAALNPVTSIYSRIASLNAGIEAYTLVAQTSRASTLYQVNVTGFLILQQHI